MNDSYPTSGSESPSPSSGQDTSAEQAIEEALRGNYDFSIGAILGESWRLTAGAKWKVHLAMMIYMVLYLAVALLMGSVFEMLELRDGVPEELIGMPQIVITMFGGGVLESLLLVLLTLPPAVGLVILGLDRARNNRLRALDILNAYAFTAVISITYLLVNLAIILGLILLIIPGIYLAFAYYMSLPLLVDRQMSPWRAMETSRKTITRKWFRFFALMIALVVINMIGAIPLGLGLIWTIPMSLIALGVAYRNMFDPRQGSAGSNDE